MSLTLNDAIADFSLVVLQGQDALIGALGDDAQAAWGVDLDAATLTLGQRSFRIAVLGTSNPADNTWMWAWANAESGLGPQHPAVAPTLAARDRATQIGIAGFADPVVSLDGVIDYGMHPGSGLAGLAAHLMGAPAFYGAPSGGPVAYLAVLDAPRQAPDVVTLPRLTMQAIDAAASGAPAGFPERHRQLVTTFAHWYSLPMSTTQTGALRVQLPSGQVDYSFDDHGRVTDMSGSTR